MRPHVVSLCHYCSRCFVTDFYGWSPGSPQQAEPRRPFHITQPSAWASDPTDPMLLSRPHSLQGVCMSSNSSSRTTVRGESVMGPLPNGGWGYDPSLSTGPYLDMEEYRDLILDGRWDLAHHGTYPVETAKTWRPELSPVKLGSILYPSCSMKRLTKYAYGESDIGVTQALFWRRKLDKQAPALPEDWYHIYMFMVRADDLCPHCRGHRKWRHAPAKFGGHNLSAFSI